MTSCSSYTRIMEIAFKNKGDFKIRVEGDGQQLFFPNAKPGS